MKCLLPFCSASQIAAEAMRRGPPARGGRKRCCARLSCRWVSEAECRVHLQTEDRSSQLSLITHRKVENFILWRRPYPLRMDGGAYSDIKDVNEHQESR